MPSPALFRVGADGTAERALARGVRRPRYQVSAAGEASKLPARRPARPILHPTLGHVGQNAPQQVMDRLSAPEDPEATIGRFARATRRQPVEFHATVHPLSGRMMSLARGNEIGVASGLQSSNTQTRRRLMTFAERHSADRPELAARATDALKRQGNLAGPRPIVVHNHPTFAGTQFTRHMPSSADTGPLVSPEVRQQNRVVSLVPHAGRGQPKTHETTFGFHPGRVDTDEHYATAGAMAQMDAETAPPAVLQRLRRGQYKPLPLERRMHGLNRAQHREASLDGGREHVNTVLGLRGTGQHTGDRITPIGASYDDLIRGGTQPGRGGFSPLPRERLTRTDRARQGGFYTRERIRKSIATDKAAGAFLHAARNPGYMLRAHPAGLATAGVGAAAAASPHHTDRGRKIRDTTAGAVAGKAGYQLVGHGAKAAARRSVQWHARMSDLPAGTDAQRARKSQIKHEQKMRGRWQRSHGNRVTGEAYRDFPLGTTLGNGGGHGGEFVPHRRARVFRAIGHTHGGRSGLALSTAASTAGAVAGYRHATREHADHVDVGRSEVVKADWGYQENRVIPVRATEWAAGAALLAYGLPRLAMTGKLIDAGVKSVAERSGEASALKFANRVTRGRSLLHRGTKPIERLRSVEQIDHAIAIIPASLRPVAAVALGAGLMSHSHPIRKPEFVPVGGNR